MRSAFVRLGAAYREHADPAWLDGWEPRAFELPGGATEIVSMGSGPPLVLLPPLPGYKESWLACAAPLARRFRVITFDLRARFDGPVRWDRALDDMRRVLDAVAPGPVAVLGHSLGGALAQQWALAHPERVRALILSSSFAHVTSPQRQWRARFVAQPLVVASQRYLPARWALTLAKRLAASQSWVYDRSCDARVLDFVRFCIRDLPLPAARTCLDLAFAHDTRERLAAIACPTLIVVGECDTPMARESSAFLARTLPHAELAISPGVGHLHPLSGAAWLVRTVSGFLDRQPQAS